MLSLVGNEVHWQSRAPVIDCCTTLWATGGDNDFSAILLVLSSFGQIWACRTQASLCLPVKMSAPALNTMDVNGILSAAFTAM